ncbi:hypothetical protein MMC12_002613 [Toensbergia leucococca]|nr:hypothetical protein [Toensbergia leucococca]
MQFCAVDRKGDTLDKAFASLSLGGFDTERPSQPTKLPDTTESRHQAENVQELSTIMLAMRKLREAIVASSRTDSFAQQSYIFIIRATILTMHMESYHPALLHLLRKIHPVTGLSTPDIHEFVGYYILDLACRQDDLAAAYAVRSEYKYRDARIDRVLKALVHDNWVLFWAVGKLVDGYQRHLMGWADDGMRSHALKSLGRSYLSVEKDYVEKSANKEWSMLKEKENVGWQLEGERVTIRRVRRN